MKHLELFTDIHSAAFLHGSGNAASTLKLSHTIPPGMLASIESLRRELGLEANLDDIDRENA